MNAADKATAVEGFTPSALVEVKVPVNVVSSVLARVPTVPPVTVRSEFENALASKAVANLIVTVAVSAATPTFVVPAGSAEGLISVTLAKYFVDVATPALVPVKVSVIATPSVSVPVITNDFVESSPADVIVTFRPELPPRLAAPEVNTKLSSPVTVAIVDIASSSAAFNELEELLVIVEVGLSTTTCSLAPTRVVFVSDVPSFIAFTSAVTSAALSTAIITSPCPETLVTELKLLN